MRNWYRYDTNPAEFCTPSQIARANGDDELADQLEREEQRALALRLGWPMPVHGLVFNEDELPQVYAEHDRDEAKW